MMLLVYLFKKAMIAKLEDETLMELGDPGKTLHIDLSEIE